MPGKSKLDHCPESGAYVQLHRNNIRTAFVGFRKLIAVKPVLKFGEP